MGPYPLDKMWEYSGEHEVTVLHVDTDDSLKLLSEDGQVLWWPRDYVIFLEEINPGLSIGGHYTVMHKGQPTDLIVTDIDEYDSEYPLEVYFLKEEAHGWLAPTRVLTVHYEIPPEDIGRRATDMKPGLYRARLLEDPTVEASGDLEEVLVFVNNATDRVIVGDGYTTWDWDRDYVIPILENVDEDDKEGGEINEL